MTNRIADADRRRQPLGTFLKDRRARLDPAAFGFSGRRRTPGLRREEVAQRANISPTWYTWLEQGRGGAPSADVLNRIAAGLMLTEAEREHLFMLGLGRPPEVRYKARRGRHAPAAAPARYARRQPGPDQDGDLGRRGLEPRRRRRADRLRRAARRASATSCASCSCDPAVRAAQHDWDSLARFVVGAFRADAARAGAVSEVAAARRRTLPGPAPNSRRCGGRTTCTPMATASKRLRHPDLGQIELEYSAFAVDGRPDLGMIVYNPVLAAVADQHPGARWSEPLRRPEESRSCSRRRQAGAGAPRRGPPRRPAPPSSSAGRCRAGGRSIPRRIGT